MTKPRRPIAKSMPASPPAAPSRVAGAVLWAALAALALARLILVSDHSMALWGINVLRFVPPAAWFGWSIAGLALVPPVGRALEPGMEALGRAWSRMPVVFALGAGVATAVLIFSFPDHLRFVGDSLIRLGGVRSDESPTVLSPQAFPLDVLIHYTVPLGAMGGQPGGAENAERWIGAFDAAGFAILAFVFASAFDVGAVARIGAAATVLFGGYLCLFTGEGKAFAEMCLVVVGFAAFALRAVRGSAGAVLGAGITLALGIMLHRFALGLLPAWLLMAFVWWRAARASRGKRAAGGPGWSALPALLGLGIPLVTIAVMTPRIVSTVLTYDLGANFATAESRASGGILGAAFAPAHLLDVFNLILFLSPLALARPFLSWGLRGDPEADETRALRIRQELILAALAIPFLLVLVFARPPQGLVRDWDSFATSGVVLSVAVAWWVARAIERSGHAWLAAAVVLGVGAPADDWLVHFNDTQHGIARLEALMLEPPGRPPVDRARTWDFLAWQHFNAGRYADAAAAFEHAVADAPSPRNLTHWAMAEAMQGRHREALALYERAVARDSSFTLGWIGVAVSAINSGDLDAAERAAHALVHLAPDNEKTREVVETLRRNGREVR